MRSASNASRFSAILAKRFQSRARVVKCVLSTWSDVDAATTLATAALARHSFEVAMAVTMRVSERDRQG